MIKKHGYIAITSILVISAIVLTIGLSVTIIAINSIQNSLVINKSDSALDLTESCVQDALNQISRKNSVNSTITIPQGNCLVTVNSHTANSWNITTSGTFLGYTKKIQIHLTRTNKIVITSWIQVL